MLQSGGAGADAALVDSLSAGLAAAVPRLTHVHAALAAWLKTDMTTVLALSPADEAGEVIPASHAAQRIAVAHPLARHGLALYVRHVMVCVSSCASSTLAALDLCPLWK